VSEQLYPWQAAYRAAITETDPARLPLKLYEAQSALEERRLSPIGASEEKALAEAEEVLRLLQNERLDSFDGQS
jgi:hypothetical protein